MRKAPQTPAILNGPPGLPSRQVGFAHGRPRFAPLTVRRYSALSLSLVIQKLKGSGASTKKAHLAILQSLKFTIRHPPKGTPKSLGIWLQGIQITVTPLAKSALILANSGSSGRGGKWPG